MSNTIIYPAIDMIGGKCVRLSQGDYASQKTYHDSPLEMAKEFEQAGATHIHLVDLDAAKGQGSNLAEVAQIAKHTKLIIQMGGGIRTEDLLKEALEVGVSRAIIGSLAAKKPELIYEWIAKYGSDTIIIGTDAKDEMIATDGWYQDSGIPIDTYIADYMANGGKHFLCTDIAKDGMLQGISLALYTRLQATHSGIHLIASGGVASMQDIIAAKALGMSGIVVGKAIYEGKIPLEILFSTTNTLD